MRKRKYIFSPLNQSSLPGYIFSALTRVHHRVTYVPPSPGFTLGLHIFRPHQGSPPGYIFSANICNPVVNPGEGGKYVTWE
jgi:hypothetical protein